jgi:hypothetical protein
VTSVRDEHLGAPAEPDAAPAATPDPAPATPDPARRSTLSQRFEASRLSSVGRRLSEDHLIRFDLRTQLLCMLGLLAFVVLVAAGIHYSSIEEWNSQWRVTPRAESPSSTIFGHPKRVRSDEWAVSTPALLNVYARPGGPSAGRRALDAVSPWTWGFYVLGLARGFSWLWNFWYLGTFFSVFLLMMLLTRNDFPVSVVSAGVLFFSSYNRWWDATAALTTFAVATTALIYCLQSRKLLNLFIAVALFCVFGLGFVLLRYPPWQVTLALLGVFIVVGFVAGNDLRANLRSHLGVKVALALVVGVGAVVGGGLAYLASATAIHDMLNTSYPGHRVSTGGDVGIRRFFAGFLDPTFSQTRYFVINICESSGFILLFPFALVALVAGRALGWIRRVRPLVWALSAYLVILSFYMLVGLGRVLSVVTLMSFVPGYRAFLGLGVAGIVLCGLYLGQPTAGRLPRRVWVPLMLLSFGGFLLFAAAFAARYTSATWSADWVVIVPVCVALAVAAGALVRQLRPVYFVVMLALVVIPSWGAIPVAHGLGPIYDKALVQQVQHVLRTRPPARWLVYGGYYTPEIVRAAGADVFNGVRFPPDVGAMKVLDPLDRSRLTWNRYAHIVAQTSIWGGVRFKLLKLKPPYQQDIYTLVVNPDNPKLRALGIRYFVARPRQARFFPASKFWRLTSVPADGYDIYESKP